MNQSFFRRMAPFFMVVLLFFQGHLLGDEGNECCFLDENPWTVRLEGAGAVGQFIGQDKNYAELGLFIAPPLNGDWFVFTDLRGYALENCRFAANAGIGARMLNPCHDRLWGGNIYYDYMKLRHGGFSQIGIGLESLGETVDFRLNGYLPLDASVSSSKCLQMYPGGWVAFRKEREFSYKGIDGEIGGGLWQKCNFDFYGAIGFYYYHGKELSNIYGGQIRLECRFMDYLTLEGRCSEDNRYHTQIQGKLIVSIPLDELISFCCQSHRCQSYFSRPVQRNGLPFFDHCCDWKWNW